MFVPQYLRRYYIYSYAHKYLKEYVGAKSHWSGVSDISSLFPHRVIEVFGQIPPPFFGHISWFLWGQCPSSLRVHPAIWIVLPWIRASAILRRVSWISRQMVLRETPSTAAACSCSSSCKSMSSSTAISSGSSVTTSSSSFGLHCGA